MPPALALLNGAAPALETQVRQQQEQHEQHLLGVSKMYKQIVARYKVKPGRAAENEELVRAVYAELHATEPEGFRYATFKLEDGVSFVHVAELDDEVANPLPGLQAFNRFSANISDRCDEQPVVSEATPIGSYRLLTDSPVTS